MDAAIGELGNKVGVELTGHGREVERAGVFGTFLIQCFAWVIERTYAFWA